jgi:hypothetical protein
MIPLRAKIKNLETQEDMEVQFNPTELTFNKTAQFAEIVIPGLDSPILQFIHGGNESFSLEFFFDTTDSGMGDNARNVDTEYVEKFYRLVKQNPNKHAPPVCLFHWGNPQSNAIGSNQNGENTNRNGAAPIPNTSDTANQNNTDTTGRPVSNAPHWFTCVVESIERKYLLFSPQGIPLRARLTVRMKEYQTLEQMVANLRSADHSRTRIFKRRERLDQLAYQAYENPTEWRRIALENDIDDPRQIEPGKVLRVPPMRVKSVIRRTE